MIMDYVAKSKRGEDHQNYGYNGRNEVVSARRTLGGSPVAGFDEDFAYDPIGNRISSTDYDETGAARTSTYTANNLNQYTARTVPGWASVRGLADAAATVAVNGNPAYMVGRAAPSAPNPDDLAYFFGSDDFDNSAGGGFAELEVAATMSDGINDLVSVVTNRVFVPPANEAYAYDADGNQTLVTTGTGEWQVEYNGENRPVRWTCGDKVLHMAYDHQGRRRLYVEVVAGVTNKLHRFTYDDYVCIARNREIDAQHGVGSDAFVWDPTEPIATQPLMCDLSGGGTLFYCHDGNKNVSEAVTPDGTIAAHYEYSSFGKVVLVKSEPNGGPFKATQADGQSIQDDSGHAKDEDAWYTSRTDVNLSPCQYDVGAFKSCMSSKRNAAWEWTAWNNCGDFVEAAVTDCLSKAQYDK